ncbi:UNVERIFIED_CONTAM: hypothetical protein Slati_4253200 [Sesamum latifolium]|uniref:DUF4216 domain-containing protein n=1 Tax=Sesamum latifolium TaxID=2727402 RepID=A0AAW2TCF4_9LAMI
MRDWVEEFSVAVEVPLSHPDGYNSEHKWTKKNIFWELEYWSTHLIRHNLDVMHIEKNVFDNIFNTVMDIKGKTKNNLNARKDLQIICNRPELEVEERRPYVMPKAVYTLTRDQKKRIFEWITSLKDWFKCRVKDEISYPENELLKLHYWGPSAEVTTFQCYFVNGYNFHTERYSVGKSTFNCGVCVKSSSYTDTDSDFYGILEEVIQLDYSLIPNMQIVLFKCRWVDPVRGMKSMYSGTPPLGHGQPSPLPPASGTSHVSRAAFRPPPSSPTTPPSTAPHTPNGAGPSEAPTPEQPIVPAAAPAPPPVSTHTPPPPPRRPPTDTAPVH